ncbi:Gfo/Idh/MocA family oxidoreductase [Microbacteriaceae bacterium VKM Ac-2855]|nr:Gfo/Idh/MocA family oxidoreductase [Microbacteriaceae bacterium VKM Ac-2855]
MSIRAGVVGYGLSGQVFHTPFLAADPAFEIAMISTSDAERAAAAHAAHPDARIVTSVDDVVSARLDLVVLASPPHVHREQAVAALDAGSAVVIDKPFAPTVADADAIIAASERSGRPVFVFQNRRWDADLLTVRRLLRENRLGRVLRFESTFERWSEPKRGRWQTSIPVSQGGGILFDLGSHLIDQTLLLFGPAAVTTAETSILHHGGASEDDAFVSLLHESGVRSHLTMSRVARASGPRLRVLGTEAAFTTYGLDPQEEAIRHGGASPLDADFGVVPASHWGVLGDEPVPSERGNYAAFYAGVAARLTSGAPSPVDVHDARAVVAVIEAAHALARA